MIVIASTLIGAVWGGYTAARRKGSRLDIAQYAAAYGIAFAILGMLVTLFVHRAMI